MPCDPQDLPPHPSYARTRAVESTVQSTKDHPQPILGSLGRNLQGTPAVRPPEGIRVHPVFVRLGLVGTLINLALHGRKPAETIPEPVLVTTSGVIISGVKEWHTAISEGRQSLHCTEYQLSDDEALGVILTLQQSRGAWNSFTRIRLALQQEPYLQSKAHANQVDGGKNKGLANLPQARQIDVRQEIAYLAGVSARNVSKVKTILQKAHPRLIEACHNGALTIHGGSQLCRYSKSEQYEHLLHHFMAGSKKKTNRQCIGMLQIEKINKKAGALLRALLQREVREPGSVAIRPGARKKTLILVGQDYLDDLTKLAGTTEHEI